MQKLYCYVDETGQDTKGVLFLVTVIITEKELENLKNFLLKIEKETNKGLSKWRKTAFAVRNSYLAEIFKNNLLRHSIFFSRYETKAYVELTILTTAKAIYERAKGDHKATIIVDGLNEKGVRRFAAGLRKLKIRVRKVRGIKDESDPMIRLADATAGFLRDYIERQKYAEKLYQKALEHKVIKEV